MEKIIVEICICTECVMHGAMDLMESVENLTEIFQHEDNDFEQREIEIITNKCIGEPKHSHECPKIKTLEVLRDLESGSFKFKSKFKSKLKAKSSKVSKRKTSKGKSSKRKTSKRKTSKRKSSKRKTSKRKSRKVSKRKTSKRKSKNK